MLPAKCVMLFSTYWARVYFIPLLQYRLQCNNGDSACVLSWRRLVLFVILIRFTIVNIDEQRERYDDMIYI